MIVMYHGLFTGRPPGFASAMICQFVIWQIINNNKSALEQQDGMTKEQEDYHVIHPAILETKSHNQVVLSHIKIQPVVSKEKGQRTLEATQHDSSSSSERGVTTFAKEFEFEFTFEFESRGIVQFAVRAQTFLPYLIISHCSRKDDVIEFRAKIADIYISTKMYTPTIPLSITQDLSRHVVKPLPLHNIHVYIYHQKGQSDSRTNVTMILFRTQVPMIIAIHSAQTMIIIHICAYKTSRSWDKKDERLR